MITELLQKNKNIIVGIVAIVALGGSFAAGRYTLPAKIVETIKTVEIEKQVVHTEYVTVEKLVYVKAVANNVVTNTVVTERPDGTKVTETKTVDLTKTEEASTKEVETAASTETEIVKSKTGDTYKAVEYYRPQWHASISIGAGVRAIGELTPQLAFGAQIERRILGPFFAGLNLSTSVGVRPALSPPLQPPINIIVGLVFGMEF